MSKLIVSKDQIDSVKSLKDKSLAESVWKELSGICSTYHEVTSSAENDKKGAVIVPKLHGNLKENRFSLDICITYSSANGFPLASIIKKKLLETHKLRVEFSHLPEQFDAQVAEKRVANAVCLVVLLTANCLQQPEVVFAMTAGRHYAKHTSQVILVHDAGSCFFPGYDEQPQHLSELFSEKAITFLGCYADNGVRQIAEKFHHENSALDNALQSQLQTGFSVFNKLLTSYEQTDALSIDQLKQALKDYFAKDELEKIVKEVDRNGDGAVDMEEFSTLFMKSDKLALMDAKNTPQEEHVKEDLSTRAFLSHKRSTGQAVAGRLYEGFKEDYFVFLDSEAKFKIHNLRQIVEETEVFIFILSSGIFQSRWCLEEIKSAISNNKQVIIVRDLAFSFPPTFPPEWQSIESVIRTKDELIWMAEYNAACIEELKKRIGPPDRMLKPAKKILQIIRDTLKETGVLTMQETFSPALPALLWLCKKEGIKISEVDIRNYKISEDEIAHLDFTEDDIVPKFVFDDHPTLAQTIGLLAQTLGPRLQAFELQTTQTDSPKFTDADLLNLGKLCPNLKRIRIWNQKHISDEGVQAFVQVANNLEYVGFQDCQASMQSIIIIGNAVGLQLKGLYYTGKVMTSKVDAACEILASKCLNLEELELVIQAGLASIFPVLQACDKITYLDISAWMNWADEDFSCLLPKLQSIKCKHEHLKWFSNDKLVHFSAGANAFAMINDSMTILAKSPNLKTLICSASNRRPPGITAVGLEPVLTAAAGMEHIDLSLTGSSAFVATASDEALTLLSQKAPKLKFLGLQYPHHKSFTDAGIEALTKGCPLLQHLDFRSHAGPTHKDITDKSVEHIAKNLQDLRYLDITGWKYVTDEGLKALSQGVPKLTTLHMRGLESVQDVSCLASLQHLLALDLKGCTSLDKKSLENLKNKLPFCQITV